MATPSAKTYRLSLVLLILAGLLVRISIAFAPTFWEEEVGVVTLATEPTADIALISLNQSRSPVFPALIHAAMRIVLPMGDTFRSIPWLRVLPLTAGLLTMLLGAFAARRWWGNTAGLFAAALFAFIPIQILASSLLVPHGIAGMFLLVATVVLLSPSNRLTPLYPLLMLPAFALSGAALWIWLLHLVLARPSHSWRQLIFILLAPALYIFAVYDLYLNVRETIPGLGFHVDKLIEAWFTAKASEPGAPPVVSDYGIMVLRWAAMGALVALAATRTKQWGEADRPYYAMALLGTVPLLLALTFSLPVAEFHSIASMFYLPAIARLLTLPTVSRSMIVLRWAVCLLLPVGAMMTVRDWTTRHHSAAAFWTLKPIERPVSTDQLSWTDERALPWLAKAGAFRLIAPDAALEPRPPEETRPLWFITHAGGDTAEVPPEARLLNHLLDTTPGVIDAPLPARWRQWRKAWLVPNAILPALKARLAEARAWEAAQRGVYAGGQVFLAGDDALRFGQGWAEPEFSEQDHIFCWSLGPEQRVEWRGPDKPGRYRLTASFWRAHPFPTREYTIAVKLPGWDAWQLAPAQPGSVVITGPIEIQEPRQILTLQFKIPTWQPMRFVEGSNDDRRLGMQFTRLSLEPETADTR